MPNRVGLSLIHQSQVVIGGFPLRSFGVFGVWDSDFDDIKSVPEGMPHFSNDVSFVHRR